jgi:predicted nucleotidyltransferase
VRSNLSGHHRVYCGWEPARLRRLADHASRALSNVDGVEGVLLFGSVARGKSNRHSDIDLLVVSSDDCSDIKALRLLLPRSARKRTHISDYNKDGFGKLLRSGSPFALHLREESILLFDRSGDVGECLESTSSTTLDVEREMAARLAQLEVFEDLSCFRRDLLFPLATIYGLVQHRVNPSGG